MTEPLADLFAELHGPIHRFLLYLTGDSDIAEELAQETFYQAFLALPRFRGDSSATTWLYGIARNVYRKSVAQSQRRRRMPPAPEPGPTPPEVAEAREEYARLAQALAGLPPTYREALVLREYEELSYAQVAQLLGGTETWARVTCFRARQMLRAAYLKAEGRDAE